MRLLTLLAIALLAAACQRAADEPEAPPAGTSAADAQAEAAPAADIVGEEVTYESDGVTLKGYLAYNAAQPGERPGVLIVHEWWGHNDYVRERARQLAGMGYTALALDMYGDGKLAAHPDDAQKFMMEALSDMAAATARFDAAQSLLEAHRTTDSTKTAAIGYCFGGAVVLHMARFGKDLDGVASFHGSLGTESPADAETLQAKILVAHGEADPLVPPEQVEAFKAEMQAADAELTFLGYPGVMHSFTNPGATAVGEEFGMPLKYDGAADKDSWAALDAFLKDAFAD